MVATERSVNMAIVAHFQINSGYNALNRRRPVPCPNSGTHRKIEIDHPQQNGI
jgi:hypothetical protein